MTTRHRPHPGRRSLFASIALSKCSAARKSIVFTGAALETDRPTWPALVPAVYSSEWKPFRMTRLYTLHEPTARLRLPFPLAAPRPQMAEELLSMQTVRVFHSQHSKIHGRQWHSTMFALDALARPRARSCVSVLHLHLFFITRNTQHNGARSVGCISILHARGLGRAAKSLCFNSIWPVWCTHTQPKCTYNMCNGSEWNVYMMLTIGSPVFDTACLRRCF